MGYARYTLNRNDAREQLFQEIWQKRPRLAGDYAKTLDLALEELADRLSGIAPIVQSQPVPVEVETESVEIDDDLFGQIEI